jgi:hypothetical protein
MKCQKNRACVKQPANAMPDFRKRCTGCDAPEKDVDNRTLPERILSAILRMEIEIGEEKECIYYTEYEHMYRKGMIQALRILREEIG